MSIFENDTTGETVVCVECGFYTKEDLGVCPNCSTRNHPKVLSSGRSMFLNSIAFLVISAILTIIVLVYLSDVGLTVFLRSGGYLLISFIAWGLFVGGITDLFVVNLIRKTDRYGRSVNNKKLIFIVVAIGLPVAIFLLILLSTR